MVRLLTVRDCPRADRRAQVAADLLGAVQAGSAGSVDYRSVLMHTGGRGMLVSPLPGEGQTHRRARGWLNMMMRAQGNGLPSPPTSSRSLLVPTSVGTGRVRL